MVHKERVNHLPYKKWVSLTKLGISNRTISGWWFSPTPLKNMSSSVGMMNFSIYGKIKKCSKPPFRFDAMWWVKKLVGGFNHFDTYELVNGKMTSHILWNIQNV